ncbi:MAG TPA: cupin domain-containing protein [Candidatus Dormibacteraeota bacterium]|nr:cupin domain-containing protein [Candidatus Dormibacteraeota bacterium]
MTLKKMGSITVVAFAMTIITSGIYSQAKDDNSGMQGHDIVRPSDLTWTPIMKGCSLAKVSGEPDTEGSPFVVRIRCNAGSRIPAHWHPTDENLTVLKGTFMVGAGEKFDMTTLKTMEPGDFMSVPKDMRHFALSKTNSTVQLHGIGPFKVNWVNPSDVLPPDVPSPTHLRPIPKP